MNVMIVIVTVQQIEVIQKDVGKFKRSKKIVMVIIFWAVASLVLRNGKSVTVKKECQQKISTWLHTIM